MTTTGHLNAVALGLALAACGHRPAKPAEEAPQAEPRSVAIAVVERVAGGKAQVPGSVRARQRATLAARVTASVVELPYREGDRVASGAVAVRLDDAALRAAVAAAEAAMASAEAELRRTEALQSKGAATPREKEDAVARASAARAAWEGARDGLAYAALRAPFAGRVARRPASVGDVVSPGEALVELEGDGGYEVVASVDASAVSALTSSRSVGVRVDELSGSLEARVTAVSPAADPTTHRFEVRADLPAAPGLRSGLFARLLLPSPAASPRLMVPSGAILQRGGLSGVFVVADGRARLRWVAVGAAEGDRTEVRAGLVAGERVASDPAALEDGAHVSEAR